MDTMHVWALWRLLMLALIALPYLVAAVVMGFRQSHGDSSTSGARPRHEAVTGAQPGWSGLRMGPW